MKPSIGGLSGMAALKFETQTKMAVLKKAKDARFHVGTKKLADVKELKVRTKTCRNCDTV